MYCENCGASIPDNVKYCPSCGAEQAPQYSTVNGQPQYQSGYTYSQPTPSIGFADAVVSYFAHYADFSGRARRSEFWYVTLFKIIVSLVLEAVMNSFHGLAFLGTLWSVGTLVPSLALCVRRLHDVGKRGTWFLFILLPIAGPIILLVQYCTDSNQGVNPYGPSSKYM